MVRKSADDRVVKTGGRSSVAKGSKASGKTRTAKSPAGSPQGGAGDGDLPTIGGYLIERLRHYGVDDLFGIPGDFVLRFYGMLEESPIRVVGCTREDCAGYAADAYARVHGIGAVCVTYCVGGLSLCNSIAGAFAEKSPVVVISGAPGMAERVNDPLLHHKVRDFNTQREVFEKITVATASLDDPLTAFREIDRCLEACVRYKRPVYLELPRDRVDTLALYPHVPGVSSFSSHAESLRAALDEASERLRRAKQPVVIAGIEVHRFGLREEVLQLVETQNIPVAATLLGKSVIGERHPLYLGVYEGAMGRQEVTDYVESSDCVLLLGTFMTDINLGIFTAKLDAGRCVDATSERLRIGHHHFQGVLLSDFVKGLAALPAGRRTKPRIPKRVVDRTSFDPQAPVTNASLFAQIDETLQDDFVVVADVGDSLFGASDLTIHQHTEFLSPAYYTSMGFSVPAALGVQVANRKLRPLVLVGDGAFQMTCMELSSMVRLRFNPIVIVLNNHGYTTERFLQEGPFNDILDWKYHQMPELLGDGWGFEIRTNGELAQSIAAALENQNSFSILNVHLRPDDISPALRRLAERMSKTV